MPGSLAGRRHKKRQLGPKGLLGVDRAVITPRHKIIYYQIPWEAKARLLPLVPQAEWMDDTQKSMTDFIN